MKRFLPTYIAVPVLATTTLTGCGLLLPLLVLRAPVDPQTAYFEAGDAVALNGLSTYFAFLPPETPNYYGRRISNVSTLPVDPADQIAIDFSIADPAEVNLSQPVGFFDYDYSSLFIGSDGVIGFGAVGSGNASLEQHFGAVQISLLPVDATDEAAGVVSYREYDDSFVVTFNNVDGSTFQLELLANAYFTDINISYLTVNANVAAGVVGLSNNQLATDANFLSEFVNSDLTMKAISVDEDFTEK